MATEAIRCLVELKNENKEISPEEGMSSLFTEKPKLKTMPSFELSPSIQIFVNLVTTIDIRAMKDVVIK